VERPTTAYRSVFDELLGQGIEAIADRELSQRNASIAIRLRIPGPPLLNASAVYESQPGGAGATYGGVTPTHTINSLHTRAARFTH
jgi:hypothetical protein